MTNTSEIVLSHQIMKGLWLNFNAADSPNTKTKTEAFDEVCMTKSCEKNGKKQKEVGRENVRVSTTA